jgi:glutathione S-transferase
MADVLRISLVRAYGERPAAEAYIKRVIDRPSFRKAHADQMAHFAAANKTRANFQWLTAFASEAVLSAR